MCIRDLLCMCYCVRVHPCIGVGLAMNSQRPDECILILILGARAADTYKPEEEGARIQILVLTIELQAT